MNSMPGELPVERQITFLPKNHVLDNNDNFSPDQRFLCYDTRDTYGPEIDRCRTIEKVEIETGHETVLYAPPFSTSNEAAPGVGAASFSPVEDKVIFIHGPLLEDLPRRGPYGKPNRNGAEVSGDGSGKMAWVDLRDIDATRDTIPGAQRGGTHRHEYSLNGKRIGCTYDDALIRDYDRTIAYCEKNAKAPEGASYYFANLIAVAPKGKSKPGQIERAWDDSWIGKEGLMRAFIGKVRSADGENYEQSLFVIDVPADVDIATADSGSAKRFPSPPKGVSIRRLTHRFASGIVRGTISGDRIAYYAHDDAGNLQLFVIPSNGSDDNSDPNLRPVQLTHLPFCADAGLRWHPSGDAVICTSNDGIVLTRAKPGENFGRSIFLTKQGDGGLRQQLVISPDGKRVAYTRPMPTTNKDGERTRAYNGSDFKQIFILDLPNLDSIDWKK